MMIFRFRGRALLGCILTLFVLCIVGQGQSGVFHMRSAMEYMGGGQCEAECVVDMDPTHHTRKVKHLFSVARCYII
mgnify:FL=1